MTASGIVSALRAEYPAAITALDTEAGQFDRVGLSWHGDYCSMPGDGADYHTTVLNCIQSDATRLIQRLGFAVGGTENVTAQLIEHAVQCLADSKTDHPYPFPLHLAVFARVYLDNTTEGQLFLNTAYFQLRYAARRHMEGTAFRKIFGNA